MGSKGEMEMEGAVPAMEEPIEEGITGLICFQKKVVNRGWGSGVASDGGWVDGGRRGITSDERRVARVVWHIGSTS